MNCRIKVYIGIIFHQQKFSHFPAALGKVCNNITDRFWKKEKKDTSYTDALIECGERQEF